MPDEGTFYAFSTTDRLTGELSMSEQRYILATDKPWHLNAFAKHRRKLSGCWSICLTPQDVADAVDQYSPRYVFFPHWSHIVPEQILNLTECVCFHMTDLPYGRGGSPLQNLIERGHQETALSALRMTPDLDAGPIYAKRPLSLDGSATEIFERSAEITLNLIEWMVKTEPNPTPQTGTPTVFRRRKPDESRITNLRDAKLLFDHIRMLDAAGYPPAFVDLDSWRIEFHRATLDGQTVIAQATFIPTGIVSGQ